MPESAGNEGAGRAGAIEITSVRFLLLDGQRLKSHAENRRNSDSLYPAMIEPVDLVDDGLNSGIVRLRGASDVAGALARPDFPDVEIIDSLSGTPRHDLARPMFIRPSGSLAGGFGEIEYGIHSQKFV